MVYSDDLGYLPPKFAVMIRLYTVANEFNVAAWYTLSRDGFFAVGLNEEDAHQSAPGDVVPVLLSPVLSRPVRSLSAQHCFIRQAAVSDSEPELSFVIGQRHPRCSRPSDSCSSLQTPPRCISPAISHSPLSSRLSAFHTDSKHFYDNSLQRWPHRGSGQIFTPKSRLLVSPND
uniref:DOMON domain-containing protein n=1 Tax=Ascaris lumbricoides TaxID=6252 RepID=A0A0M3I4B3_ASCLU